MGFRSFRSRVSLCFNKDMYDGVVGGGGRGCLVVAFGA